MGEQEADTEACLKYLFTFREFSEGTTGLGWKGSICTKKFKSRRMAPRNCGLVTFLNNNKTRNIAEIGHNFGANHEEDTPCEAAAGRLMAAFEEPHSSRAESFSNCASQCVRENLRAALESDRAMVHRCPSLVELLWEGRRQYCFTQQ